MASLNECNFIGNLGADPEIKTMQNGNKVANFSIACTEKWRDKNSGESKERTEWVRVVVWQEGLVKVIEQYVKKGSKVYVSGQMQTRKWQDQSGADRYSTEIVLQGFGGKLILLDGSNNSAGEQQQSERPQANRQQSNSAATFEDDDLPF